MDLNNLLYNQRHDILPQRGSLLIADPMMEELYFKRSVVMILDDDTIEGGQLGLTLNKATNLTLHDITPGWKKGFEVPIYCGGPVDMGRLFLLHTLGDIFRNSTEVSDGIYIGGDFNDIIDYIEGGEKIEGKLRFFLGYSGWSAGQLAGEIDSHTWAVNTSPVSKGLLQGEENEFWRREVENLGEAYRSWLMVPQNPAYN
ncbi:MAG: YqgE/AlgH family protein [Muribaculaceae bacterium]|nr:YqgE/AlgH family protein [Muribaculaceae bacterium]MDE6754602.1 YqgE/AlgH family protein [Muribaculaceae bacterium]